LNPRAPAAFGLLKTPRVRPTIFRSFSQTAHGEFIRHRFDTFQTYPGPLDGADVASRGNAVEIETQPTVLTAQEVAYNSVLTDRRKLLHGQTAAALEALHSGHLEDHLNELAHHYSRSGNAAKAIEYLRRATEQATARSAFQEAMNQLHAALGLLESLAPGPARDGHELTLRMALLMPMIATHGFTSEDAKLNLERARALCSGIGDTITTVRVLTGLRTSYFVAGELLTARELAGQMLEIAARSPDDVTTYLANQALATAAAWRENSVAPGSISCELWPWMKMRSAPLAPAALH
jgi:hypothetical protein